MYLGSKIYLTILAVLGLALNLYKIGNNKIIYHRNPH